MGGPWWPARESLSQSFVLFKSHNSSVEFSRFILFRLDKLFIDQFSFCEGRMQETSIIYGILLVLNESNAIWYAHFLVEFPWAGPKWVHFMVHLACSIYPFVPELIPFLSKSIFYVTVMSFILWFFQSIEMGMIIH